MGAWNGWYHITAGTYGTWLPGDGRGWRTRHHRRDVRGDYKNPPAKGSGDGLRRLSQRLLKNAPVVLSSSQRQAAGRAVVESLIRQGIETLCLAMGAEHCHLLARVDYDEIRKVIGRAKLHAYHALSNEMSGRRIWAKRSRALPIRDRQHQVNVYNYILKHRASGAWVWSYREGAYWIE